MNSFIALPPLKYIFRVSLKFFSFIMISFSFFLFFLFYFIFLVIQHSVPLVWIFLEDIHCIKKFFSCTFYMLVCRNISLSLLSAAVLDNLFVPFHVGPGILALVVVISFFILSAAVHRGFL